MKIIYDDEKAAALKAEIDTETTKWNEEVLVYNRSRCVIAILCFIAVTMIAGSLAAWLFRSEEKVFPYVWCGQLVCVAIISILGAKIFLRKYPISEMAAERQYPASVKFHVATTGKTILDGQWTRHNIGCLGDYYSLALTLEDEAHFVTTTEIFLWGFKTQTRTDITEIVVNLDEETVDIPHKGGKQWKTT